MSDVDRPGGQDAPKVDTQAVRRVVGDERRVLVSDGLGTIRWIAPDLALLFDSSPRQLVGTSLDRHLHGGESNPVANLLGEIEPDAPGMHAADVWIAGPGRADVTLRLEARDARSVEGIEGFVLVGRDVDATPPGGIGAIEALLLERIAASDESSIVPILRDIARYVERTVPGTAVAVGANDGTDTLRHLVAPSLDQADLVAINRSRALHPAVDRPGLHPVDLTALDGLHRLVDRGLRCSWSLPLLSRSDWKLLGSLLVLVDEHRPPTEEERATLRRARSLGSLALERDDLVRRIRHQSLHDSLTGLPNRNLIIDRVGQVLARTTTDPDRRAAVLLIDLDGFKDVNDALGHSAGDNVLRATAERMRAIVGAHGHVGRFGGDEFLVVLEVVDAAEAFAVAEQVRTGLDAVTPLWQSDVTVTASIGMSIGRSLTDAEALVRDADAATHEAKARGGNRVVAFETEFRSEALRRVEVEASLRVGLAREEIEVHYQPIVDAETGAVVALEALARWRHPSGGMIPPDRFVPVAEKAGLMELLGRQVLRRAVGTAARLRAAGHPGLGVAVNLSARELVDGVADEVREVLDEFGLDPGALTLEITETAFALPEAESVVARLTGLGVEVAVDDFGTGWSGLEYLRRFPEASVLKLDGVFVRDLTGPGPAGQAIVASAVVLGHSLDMRVVAEGVERTDEVELLRELGCDRLQGYVISPPVAEADLDEMFRSVARAAVSHRSRAGGRVADHG